MKKTIEIVSHCYAGIHSQYAAALCYQLSSFCFCKPSSCNVLATVCYLESDRATVDVLDFFSKRLDLNPICLPDVGSLGRRSIGRNKAALQSKADIVWFADVDQVYWGCLDLLADYSWPDDVTMIYPQAIHVHRDHAIGDEALKLVKKPQLIKPNLLEFGERGYRKAIGGVQIVKGDFARTHGYLNEHKKWQRPVDIPFGNFRDDIAYRQFVKLRGKIIGVDLPGMLRLRHTRTTYQ